ncbi:hypothetical protein PAXINDRAFT_17113 [Paxillus involutus ATCC 200175]|uniref:Transmembrane protein n=1 Tax=Paxillus involutus ATCC 200175 TaxID=664439 RepID=A0A0C9TPV6_PAXIN|nr:hypothetical protein PAXINDRAFT_17113 [Paxillus involutus ATCC 200175]
MRVVTTNGWGWGSYCSVPPCSSRLPSSSLPSFASSSLRVFVLHVDCWGGRTRGAHRLSTPGVDVWCLACWRLVDGVGRSSAPRRLVVCRSLALCLPHLPLSPSFLFVSLTFLPLPCLLVFRLFVLHVDTAGVAALVVHAWLSTPCIDARRLAWSWGWAGVLWMRRVWTWWARRLPSVISSSAARRHFVSPLSSLLPRFASSPYHSLLTSSSRCTLVLRVDIAGVVTLAVHTWLLTPGVDVRCLACWCPMDVVGTSSVVCRSSALRLSLVFPSPSVCSTSLPFHFLTSSSRRTLVLRVDTAGVATLAVHAQLSTPGVEATDEVAWDAGESLGRQWVVWAVWTMVAVFGRTWGTRKWGVVFGIGGVLVGYFSSGGVGTYLPGWIGGEALNVEHAV